MIYSTLVSTHDLAAHLADPEWAIVDCCFDLVNTAWGEQQYRESHIPGAVYAHLDRDLSGPKTGKTGRHPLPGVEQFKTRLGQWGIGPGVQVVVYDQDVGMYASRLWWMLKYLGHTAAAVLDGGRAKWVREGRPTRSAPEHRAPARFAGSPHDEMRVTVDGVERMRLDPDYLFVDARAPERFRGETEPFDPVAGRIPGAVNLFCKDQMNPDGTFLSPEILRARYQALLGRRPAQNVVIYCGSGVTSAHDLLGMEIAGLPGAKIYVGSWSEWCADPARPVARGS
jgi:thiosulfate/3-mercaptopyruvate sulfurtransferase